MNIEDYFDGGVYLSRWEIVDGQPVRTPRALKVCDANPQEIAEVKAWNQAVRDTLAAQAAAASDPRAKEAPEAEAATAS